MAREPSPDQLVFTILAQREEQIKRLVASGCDVNGQLSEKLQQRIRQKTPKSLKPPRTPRTPRPIFLRHCLSDNARSAAQTSKPVGKPANPRNTYKTDKTYKPTHAPDAYAHHDHLVVGEPSLQVLRALEHTRSLRGRASVGVAPPRCELRPRNRSRAVAFAGRPVEGLSRCFRRARAQCGR